MKVLKIQSLLMTAIVLLSSLSRAGDEHNHIHLDQVANGASDNLNLSIDQIGYENLIRFSFNHNDNTVICCLECNLKKGTMNDEKFKFTKQLKITKLY